MTGKLGVIAAAMLMAAPPTLMAQPMDARPAASRETAIDPAAIAALERMSAYLRSLEAFELRTDTMIDEAPLDRVDGELIGSMTYRLRKPDALFIDIRSENARRIYYDGSVFTLFAPRLGYYAQVTAPRSAAALLEAVERNYGIIVPLTDLFGWGTSESHMSGITSATSVGIERLEGEECDRYAFRQNDLDWQIWIARSDHPVPRKIVMTAKLDGERPQFVAQMHWLTNPRFDAATFAFEPPADAHRIEIERALGPTL